MVLGRIGQYFLSTFVSQLDAGHEITRDGLERREWRRYSEVGEVFVDADGGLEEERGERELLLLVFPLAVGLGLARAFLCVTQGRDAW
jgi:hypothetical protein